MSVVHNITGQLADDQTGGIDDTEKIPSGKGVGDELASQSRRSGKREQVLNNRQRYGAGLIHLGIGPSVAAVIERIALRRVPEAA